MNKVVEPIITFYEPNTGRIVGRLFISNGVLWVDGNLSQSADIFFNVLLKNLTVDYCFNKRGMNLN